MKLFLAMLLVVHTECLEEGSQKARKRHFKTRNPIGLQHSDNSVDLVSNILIFTGLKL